MSQLQLQSTQQAEFDKRYITGSEIAGSLNVSRSAIVYARRRGILPDPIIVFGSKTHLWLRKEVTPRINAWKADMAKRLGHAA